MDAPVKLVITLLSRALLAPDQRGFDGLLSASGQPAVDVVFRELVLRRGAGLILSADWLWSHAATVPLARSLTQQSMTNF